MTDLTKKTKQGSGLVDCTLCGSAQVACFKWTGLFLQVVTCKRTRTLVFPAESWHRTRGSRHRKKKVSVSASTCLQPVKFIAFEDFSTYQSVVCVIVHTMTLIHMGIFAVDNYSVIL